MHARLSDAALSTVWFQGRPYPVSAYPVSSTPAGSSWYVLHEDGHWYRVRERRDADLGADGWRTLEADVIAWLDRYHAAPPRATAANGGRYVLAAPHAHAQTVQNLQFDNGCQATDFLRRLGVLFDGRTTRLIVPSMPMVIYGPAVLDPNEAVTLYAGRGALALARYLGLAFPTPGPEIATASLEGRELSILFGPMARGPEPWPRA